MRIDPWEIGRVIDLILEGQQTIRVDEDRDAPQAEGLIEAHREVAAAAHADRVIGIEDVVDKFKFGWVVVGFVLGLPCAVASAGDVIGVDAGLVLKALQDPGTEGGCLERRRLPFELPLAVLLLLPLQSQGAQGGL